ncbi:MAG: TonB-dependent receptor domain-containing protein [Flavobacteriia bacterium]|jgi:iron complex outermembrane receptor protein
MHIKITLFFILSFFVVNSYAQGFEIKVKVRNVEKDCDTDFKQFTLIQKKSTGDSIVFTLQDSVCSFSKTVALQIGNYVLKTKSMSSTESELLFSITENSNATIDLGLIKLVDKISEISEVTITGIPKKFIVVDPEKTIVLVENNPILESSSIYNAITKIPGIIPSPNGGFAYSGQIASVFFESIPSTLSPMDLDNLLKSLPANSVKKIELITNPGASYDANFSGAIIDIISNDKAFKWLSGSISLNTGINKNMKTMPTFLLNGKAKRFTWNIQSTASYQESNVTEKSDRTYTFLDSLQELYSLRQEKYTNRYYSNRGNLVTKLSKKSTLQLNANINTYSNQGDGNSQIETNNSDILPFTSNYESKGKGYTFDGGLKYRIIMDSLNRKIEFSSNYTNSIYENRRTVEQITSASSYSLIKSNSKSQRLINRLDFEIPLADKKTQVNFGAKITNLTASNEGAYRFNDSIQLNWENTNFSSTIPFDYIEQNLAFYSEYKRRIKKSIAVTLGLRAEDFSFKGMQNENTLISRNFLNLYPSVHTLYRISPDMNLMINYSRKINLPNYGMYDPNLNGYYDSYTQNSGNNKLDPNFLHRSQAKLSIFEYCQLSLTHTFSNSINLTDVTVDSSSFAVNYTFKTYNNVQSFSGFFSLPVPFGFFTQGLDFFRQAINVDEISFMYLYTNCNKTTIPGYNYINKNKALWSFGVYSQFILPFKIRLNLEYNFTAKGTDFIAQYTQNIHDFEAVLSREFYQNKWRVSATFQDVFNKNRTIYGTIFNPLTTQNYSKWDTQVLWLKIAYSFGKYERPSLKEDAIPTGKGA